MPRKATGKRSATAAEQQTPSTPVHTRQRRIEPTSATSTPATIASATATPTSSSSSSSSAASTPSSSSGSSAASSSPAASTGAVYRLKVTLIGSSPPIWRRVLVPSYTTLHVLHLILQILFDWDDVHLHQFTLPRPKPPRGATDAELLEHWLGGRDRRFRDNKAGFGIWDYNGEEDEDQFTVGELLRTVKDKLVYEYDFGDSWDHLIQLEAFEPARSATSSSSTIKLPQCTAGRCAAPAEDSGGIGRHGYLVWHYKKEKGLLPSQRAHSEAKTAEADDEKKEEEAKEEDENEHNDEDRGSSDHDLDDEDDDQPDVKGWLAECSAELGFDYDPLHFDKQRINRRLEQAFGF